MKLIYYIVLLVLVSCKTTQPKDHISLPTELQSNKSQIAFFFLEASKNKKDYIEVKLNKQKIVNGKLKETYLDKIPKEKIQNANWLVSFLNNSNKSITQLQIANPLVEEIEYVNENGLLEKKTIYHDKKGFVIRIPYDDSIKNISFEEYKEIDQKITSNFINQITIE